MTRFSGLKKTRELRNMLMDSKRWDGFKFRDGDIVIDTWAKSGTTWTQQIVSQLIFDGAENLPAMDLAPWVDMVVLPLDEIIADLEAQTHRRLLKTHLPADALDISPKAKYIFLARDGKDVVWSWYAHLKNMTPGFFDMINDAPDRVGPPLERPKGDVREFFHDWLDNDGLHDWSYWAHIQSWWDIRDLPNVHLFHYNDLKADMPGEMRRMADFLGIEIDEERWPDIVEHCTFDYMKKNADTLSPFIADLFKGGLKSFVYKGTNDRWRDVLTPEDLQKYDDVANANLTPNCAHWHATGEMSN
ncbi:MAG: sulfotransferase domain-containing protein [Gemmatimonadales bacterium]